MMAKQTGGILNLTKPEIADNIKQTIGEILPDNFQAISDIVSEHLANEDMHVLEEEKTGWDARETTEGAQAKADTAELSAKSYADNKVNSLAGAGRTTETVKGNADKLALLERQIDELRAEITALKGSRK
jgi:hypothetical protein